MALIYNECDFYVITDNEYLNNLPIDAINIIIELNPCQDLTNLPTSLENVFFKGHNTFFDNYEIDDVDKNKYKYIIAYDEYNNMQFNKYYNLCDNNKYYIQFNYDTIPTCGINTYAFSLNPEPIIKTFKIKVPFGCKIYNYKNQMVIPNGYIKVKM